MLYYLEKHLIFIISDMCFVKINLSSNNCLLKELESEVKDSHPLIRSITNQNI